MALITPPVVYPAILAGKRNGELPTSILTSTPGLAGGPTVRLVLTATRCWRAMSGTALQDGVTLQATSYGDSYRWLALQKSTFTSRYQLEPTGNGYKLWDSDGNGTRERWYKMDGVASAAVPGTSHHGWGITVDVANATGARLRWLELNAPHFGWAWELVPEEPWHLNNFTGDAIPAAVLAYEEAQMTQPVPRELVNVDQYAWEDHNEHDPVKGIKGGAGEPLTIPNLPLQRQKRIEAGVQRVEAGVAELLARPPGQVELTPEDLAAIVSGVVAQLTPVIGAEVAKAGAEARDAVADGLEGGSAAVRADA